MDFIQCKKYIYIIHRIW